MRLGVAGRARGAEAGERGSHGQPEAERAARGADPGPSPAPPLQAALSVPRNPMVTGTSVLGVKFDGGVVLAADMLGSYGSLARFRNISRIMRVNNSTMLGASGDYADFQYLKQVLGQMV